MGAAYDGDVAAGTAATSDDDSASDRTPPPLDPSARSFLLGVARSALEAAVGGHRSEPPPAAPVRLGRTGGAFVSLHGPGDDLRGCVGLLRSDAPIEETVARMAVAAATDDHRFARVRREELPNLVIEISALSPMRWARPEEVEVGKHGVLVRARGASGVLLPQVAPEHGWSREELLARTAQKAGLPRDAWRDAEAEIHVFTAEVFAERTFRL